MEYIWAAILLILTAILYFKLLRRSTSYTYPRGPKGWPVLGNIFDIDISRAHKSLAVIGKHHGDIFSVDIIGKKIVVLNSPDMIRKAFAGQVFSGRPHNFASEYTIFGKGTSFMDPDENYYKQRKILHKTLKMYGDGVQQMETIVVNELKHVVERLDDEKELDLKNILYVSIANITTILILGQRLEYDDPTLNTIIEMLDNGNKMATIGADVTLKLFPVLRHIPLGYGYHFQMFQKSSEQLRNDFFVAPKDSFDPNVTRGLLDVLLKIQSDAAIKGENSWLKDDVVIAISEIDVLGAGIVTTRGTLLSFFLITLHKPEVAKRIQFEVDAVIGAGRFPSLTDRVNMPYTEACILETLRFISHVPLGVPRCTTEDVTFEGYHLPANTMVLANMWSIHHDEALWEDPWVFWPERFLNESGELLSFEHPTRRNMMAFGAGRRSCIGETFAKSRIFLYITTFLQRFDLKIPNTGEPLPSMDPRHFATGLTLSPETYRVRFVPRN